MSIINVIKMEYFDYHSCHDTCPPDTGSVWVLESYGK